MSSRVFGVLVAVGALVLLAAETAQAQRQGGPPRGGGQFGRTGSDPISLLQIEAIRKELELGEDQSAEIRKLREAMNDEVEEMRRKIAEKYTGKLGDVLLPHQTERVKQISLQMRGVRALDDAAIAKELGITEDQKKQIEAKREEYSEKARALRGEGGGGGDFRERIQKYRELQTQSNEAVLGVLSSTQREKFDKMKGKEFDRSQLFQRPGGGGNQPEGTPRPKRKRPDTE